MKVNKEVSINYVLKDAKAYSEQGAFQYGPTKYGFSIHDLRVFNNDPTIPESALLDLTEAEAFHFYDKHYWQQVYGAYLPNGVDYMVFDIGVLCGPTNALRWLKSGAGEEIDAEVTHSILARIENTLPLDLIMSVEHMARRRCRSHPHYVHFQQLWTNRITCARVRSVKMLKK